MGEAVIPDGNQNKLIPLLLYLGSQTMHPFESLLDSHHSSPYD
jgi:hypothetical protein